MARLPTDTPYGAHMDIGQYGDLNSLQWVENEFDPSPNMLHCEVVYGEPQGVPSSLTDLPVGHAPIVMAASARAALLWMCMHRCLWACTPGDPCTLCMWF